MSEVELIKYQIVNRISLKDTLKKVRFDTVLSEFITLVKGQKFNILCPNKNCHQR